MLVFIDESGDPGFKVARGSSPLFVVAMVIFADRAEAAKTQQTVRRLLERVQRRPEFKFNKCRNEIRDAFFETVRDHSFTVRGLVVRKELIWSEQLRADEESFYRFFIKSMVKFDKQALRNASVIIDGSGDRAFRRSLAAYLRRHTARALSLMLECETPRVSHFFNWPTCALALSRGHTELIAHGPIASDPCSPEESRTSGSSDDAPRFLSGRADGTPPKGDSSGGRGDFAS